jgi:uncharacterized protein DUF2846
MTSNRAFVVVSLAVLASACASVPLAPPEADAQAKQFQAPPPGHANLYVYRNEGFGGAVRMSVNLDGAALGDTAAKTYLYTPIPAGTHTVVSKSENDSTAIIDARAGESYFVWQEVKMGLWSARSALQQVAEDRGRAGVLECKMGMTHPPAGCSKDTDCKGNRVCEAGACVEVKPGTN